LTKRIASGVEANNPPRRHAVTCHDCGRVVQPAAFPYVWAWRVRPVGEDRKGQRCRVLVRGAMNSALVEFEDGVRYVTSRNGLRRKKR
jgi:hypothetical protein